MSPGGRRLLWIAIAVGTLGRVVVAFATYGQHFDLGSFFFVNQELERDPLHVYGTVNGFLDRWPYPPGFFPWILASGELADASGLAFHGLIQLPSIAADAALAWIVQDFLGKRGLGERGRLAAAGLVTLGPSFALISGYHGQIDSLAILPAVLALVVWETPGRDRRWLAAGLLIGLGGALKTVPLLLVLALLPSARSVREGVGLVAAAAAVPLALLAPFAFADPDDVLSILGYSGGLGMGGVSLVLQPSLAELWLRGAAFQPSAVTQALLDHGSLVSALALVAVGAFLIRSRTSAATAAVVVWLAVYVLATGFFFQYLVWGLPFFLLAGCLRETAALQAAVLLPALLFYTGPWADAAVVWLYVPLMLAVWVAFLVAFVRLVRAIASSAPPSAEPLTARAA